MTGNVENVSGRRGSRLRIVAWTTAALLLLLPLIAMQFTDEVNWSLSDFVIFGGLLLGAGVAYELAVRMTANSAYRIAFGVAIVAAFLLVWVNGAVGLIGSENNDVNLMFFGVLIVGIIGAFIARFRPDGMVDVLFAMALMQALIAVVALLAGMHNDPYSSVGEILGVNGFFVALFVGSALLFRKAAHGEDEAQADEAALTQGVSKKLTLHRRISTLIILIGFVLLMYMITVEDEPGAVPLLLIVAGIGWYFFKRARLRSQSQ